MLKEIIVFLQSDNGKLFLDVCFFIVGIVAYAITKGKVDLFHAKFKTQDILETLPEDMKPKINEVMSVLDNQKSIEIVKAIANKVTDETKITLPDAIKVVTDELINKQPIDTNKKAIQRTARKLLYKLIK